MTLYYTQIPPLDARARASRLAIVGKIGRILETNTESYEDKTYVRTTFDVEVEEILKGQLRETHVAVQILGGRAEQAETPMQLPAREGERMVLMLSEGDKEGVFVPYLGSAFVVKGSRVELGEHAAEILAGPPGAATKSDISVDDVRNAVAEAERLQPEEQAPRPQEPPPIREMPTGYEGAGRPGAPGTEPESYQ